MRSRVFHCVQCEFNPKDGTDLHFNEENIKNCISHKSIKKWVYIRHDKDPYTEEDKDHLYGHKIGDLKNAHWHVVLQCDTAIEVEVIAKWLGIPMQQVKIPKGHGKFLDNVKYVTHEDAKQQKLGKHLYDDDEMTANFDWRGELTRREENKLKYGRDLDREQQILFDVMYNGKTINQVISEDSIFYMNNHKKIDAARQKYLLQCNPPGLRINFYVNGKGGAGKGLLSRALARSLFPNLENDDDIFFSIGDGKTTFEGYDGQPIIVWNDCRSIELFNMLGSRGNIFKVFDTHPVKERQNIKYGSTNLINAVNIINSTQSYTEFLNGLAGEYTSGGVSHKAEDKGQSYRRFPFIINILEEDIAVLLNKGFAENTKDFMEYIQYGIFRGNLEKVAVRCGNNIPLCRRIEGQITKPIVDKYTEIADRAGQQQGTDTEILEEFKDYGQDTGYVFPFL